MDGVLWENGSQLRTRFLEGSSLLQQRVLRIAQIWSAYANVTFVTSNDEDAEIRIAFKQHYGSWSHDGTRSLLISNDNPTMNFGWLNDKTSSNEIEAIALHEFGHVLGLLHEHNNPDSNINCNREAVYKPLAGLPNL
jgi:hypothetical protein